MGCPEHDVNQQDRINWLQSLKEGDDVYVTNGRFGGGAIYSVTKRTPNQIFIGRSYHARFTVLDGGGGIGHGWERIERVTSGLRRKLREAKAISEFNRLDARDLHYSEVKAMLKALAEHRSARATA